MKLRRLIILASGGLMLLGAACGGDSKDSSDAVNTGDDSSVTTAASAAGADNASSGSSIENCEVIEVGAIAGVFGGEFTAMQDTSQGATIICNTQRGEPVTSVQYTIKPTSAGEYDPTIRYSKESGATAEPISGIGEKATRLTSKQHGVTVIQVIVAKGNALFYVTVSGQETYATQAEQVAKLLADNL
ncbi:MAG: hypothetical protein Q8K63_14405 [Acidimicrobiales bacterium]|nr:hypothetical protein [Acidimicrobiales bacterium]